MRRPCPGRRHTGGRGLQRIPGCEKLAADSIVKVTETIEPDGELTEKYEKQYSKFRADVSCA